MSTTLRLEPVELLLRRQPGPLLAQIQKSLGERGEPLRWAITGVEPDGAESLLRIEAMVISRP